MANPCQDGQTKYERGALYVCRDGVWVAHGIAEAPDYEPVGELAADEYQEEPGAGAAG